MLPTMSLDKEALTAFAKTKGLNAIESDLFAYLCEEAMTEYDRTLDSSPISYLAAPYSSPHTHVEDARLRLVNIAAARLMSMGMIIYSPLSHTAAIHKIGFTPSTHEFWLRQDLPYLIMAEEVIVCQLFGWDKSVGVKLEIFVAKLLDKPVRYGTLDATSNQWVWEGVE